ncbi:MAG: alpha-galactosidase [Muribaculaceae bacterium]|nr:alpha-galactosidase [Muribaculaceae bacterium]
MKRTLFTIVVALTILSLSAQRTPTMGWSSWNTFALDINEDLIRAQADAMHTSGLQDAGYRYVNIDDGYWNGRDESGNLRLNSKLFPNGMRPLVDYIHSLGLKAGIYSDAGDNTCGSAGKHAWGLGVGFANHEEADCKVYFKDWDFDFIKVDYCGGMHLNLNERQQYTKISQAIKNSGKSDVVFNICRWAYPGTWVSSVSDSWRTTGDISDKWESVRKIINENLCLSAYCHDGHYNDMDMLEVGRSMSQVEDETHFAMWCIMSSPLLIGCDLTTIKPETLRLLTNADLIALNQDPLHLQPYIVEKQGDCFILVKDIKKIHDSERAIAIYNPSDYGCSVMLDLVNLELGGSVKLYDCIQQKEYGKPKGNVSINVPAHGARVFRAKADKRLERVRYEAEAAWMSSYQEIQDAEAAGTAIYVSKQGASGGYVAGQLGKSEANDIQWRDVWVKKAGKHMLSVTYFTDTECDMKLMVNGDYIGNLKAFPRTRKSVTISYPVTLKQGFNTIRLSNSKEQMPEIDYISIEPAK